MRSLLNGNNKTLFVVGCLAILAPFASAAPKEKRDKPLSGYYKRIVVQQEGRIDWTRTANGPSMAVPPAEWTDGYTSIGQEYELYAPPFLKPNDEHPVILFVSASAGSQAWPLFEPVCKRLGCVLIAPLRAGNDSRPEHRLRIVLDCFDDLRRRVRVDPNRTYVAGFSGGGKAACQLAYTFPEHFGGLMPICGALPMRSDTWLRQRFIDRVSVAFITGEKDFNREPTEKGHYPAAQDAGVRSNLTVVKGMAHELPRPETFIAAIEFLEQGRDKRMSLAKQHPATCVPWDGAPHREARAQALVDEAIAKIGDQATSNAGITLLEGCLATWPDVPAAAVALKKLQELNLRGITVQIPPPAGQNPGGAGAGGGFGQGFGGRGRGGRNPGGFGTGNRPDEKPAESTFKPVDFDDE